MSNTSDLINLIRDVLVPVGLTIFKYGSPVETVGTERIVLNSIPNTQVRAGTTKINNDLVNVNFYVPKDSAGRTDSARIEEIEILIQNAFENYNGTTTRVGYSYLDARPMTVFNEEKENFINIRVEATYT